MDKVTSLRFSAWGIGALVVVLAWAVWAQTRLGSGGLSMYDIFPLLGLGAFSLMWSHYILGAIRRMHGLNKSVLRSYNRITNWLVLMLILLHPGLLIYQLNNDGLGLPPQSYLEVYPKAQHFALMLGSVSLLIFLAFELKHFLETKKIWKYIEYAQLLAMGMIYYHGLTLGGELSQDWFRLIWYVYGVSLVGAVVYNYWYDSKHKEEKKL